MCKIRLYFKKYGELRFIGHLDLLKMIQRAVTRADIPVAFSQGFNPHQLVSFALPLPVGYQGLSEIVEIDLEQDMSSEACIKSLNGVLPEGVMMTKAEMLKEGDKTAASLVAGAVYDIEFPESQWDHLADAAAKIMNMPEILIEKESKNKTQLVDIKGLITDISTPDPGVIRVECAAGSVKSVRLDYILERLYDCMNLNFSEHKYGNQYTRRELVLSAT